MAKHLTREGTCLSTKKCPTVTQDLLLEHVWGAEYAGESHILQVNVNRLRHKLEPDPAHPRYILTKVGIGYFMTAQSVVHTTK